MYLLNLKLSTNIFDDYQLQMKIRGSEKKLI